MWSWSEVCGLFSSSMYSLLQDHLVSCDRSVPSSDSEDDDADKERKKMKKLKKKKSKVCRWFALPSCPDERSFCGFIWFGLKFETQTHRNIWFEQCAELYTHWTSSALLRPRVSESSDLNMTNTQQRISVKLLRDVVIVKYVVHCKKCDKTGLCYFFTQKSSSSSSSSSSSDSDSSEVRVHIYDFLLVHIQWGIMGSLNGSEVFYFSDIWWIWIKTS